MTAAAEVHEIPLANRIVDRAVMEWLNRHTATALAAAGSGDLSDYERGKVAGIEDMRYGRLDDYWYTLTLTIVDELRRGGLLPPQEAGP